MGSQSSRAFFGEAMQEEGCLWVPDPERAACFHCEAQFTFRCRRHHCRICGELFCATQRPVYGVKKKKANRDSNETAAHHTTKNATIGYGAVDAVDDNQEVEKLGTAPTCWGPRISLSSNLFPSAIAMENQREEYKGRKMRGQSKGGSRPSNIATEIFFNEPHDEEDVGGAYSPSPPSSPAAEKREKNARRAKLVKLLLQEPQAVCTVCYRLMTFPLLRQLSLNIRSVMSDHQPRNVFVVRVSLHAITHKRSTAAGSSRNEHFLTLEALARAEAAGLDVVPMLAMMKDKKTSDRLIEQEEQAFATLSASVRQRTSSNPAAGADDIAQRLLASAAAVRPPLLQHTPHNGPSRSVDELPMPTNTLLLPPSTHNEDLDPCSPTFRRAPIASLLETPAFSVAYPQQDHSSAVGDSRMRAASINSRRGTIPTHASNGSINNENPDGLVDDNTSLMPPLGAGEDPRGASVTQPPLLLNPAAATCSASVDPTVESTIAGPNALDVATALTDALTHHSTRPIGGTGLLEMTLEQWRPFNKQTRFVFRVPDLDLYQAGGTSVEDQLSPMLRKVTIPPLFEAAAVAAELEERRRRNRMLMKREFDIAGVRFPGEHYYSAAMVNNLGNATPTNMMMESIPPEDEVGSPLASPTDGMLEAEEEGKKINFPEPKVRGRVMSGIPGTFLDKSPSTVNDDNSYLPTMTPTTHLLLAAGTGSRGGHRPGEYKPTKQGNAHNSDFGEAATGRDAAAREADNAARLEALALRDEPISPEELLRMRLKLDEEERIAEEQRMEQEKKDLEEFERRQAEAAEEDRLRKDAEMERRRLEEEAKKAARKSKPYFNHYHTPTAFDEFLPRSVDEREKNDEFADYSVPAKIILASNTKCAALEKAYTDFNSKRVLGTDGGDAITSGGLGLQEGGTSSAGRFVEDPHAPNPAVSERRIKAAFNPRPMRAASAADRRVKEKKALDSAARQFRQDTIYNKLAAVPGATPLISPSSVKRASRLVMEGDGPSPAYPIPRPAHSVSTLSGVSQVGTAPFLQHATAHQEEIAKQLSHINFGSSPNNGAPALPLRSADGGEPMSAAAFKSTGPSGFLESSVYHPGDAAVAPALKKKSRRGKRFTDLSLYIAEDGSQLEVKLPPVWSLSCSSVVGIELMQGRQVDPEKIAEEKKKTAEKIAEEEGEADADSVANPQKASAQPPRGNSPTIKPSKSKTELPTAGSAPVPLGVVGTHYLRVETFQEIYYFTFDIDHQQQQGVVKREQKALRKREKSRTNGYTALEEEARRNLGMGAEKEVASTQGEVGSAVHLRPLGDLYTAITGYTIPDAATLTAAAMVEALRRKRLAKDGKGGQVVEGSLIVPRSSPEAVVNYMDEDLTDPEKVRELKAEQDAASATAEKKKGDGAAAQQGASVGGPSRPLTGADLYGAMRQAVDMARVRGRVRVSSVRIGGM